MIIGCDRSGTTVLAKNLSQNINNSIVLPEAHWLQEYIWFRMANQPVETFIKFCSTNGRFKPFLESGIPILQYAIDNWETKKEIKFEIEHIMCQSAKFLGFTCNEESILIEHTPWSYKNFYLINEVFNVIKWIHIVRDGRDVAISLTKVKWGPNNLFTAIKYWTETIIDINNIFQGRKDFLTIRYESLLDSPTKEISSILENCNQKKGKSSFQFSIPQKYFKQHAKYKDGLDNRNQLKWKKLGNNKKLIFEFDIRTYLLLKNYEYHKIKFRQINIFRKLYYYINDIFWRIIRKI